MDFLQIANLPLGITEANVYEQCEDQLNSGDKLVLYTDGVSEAHLQDGLFEIEGIERACWS